MNRTSQCVSSLRSSLMGRKGCRVAACRTLLTVACLLLCRAAGAADRPNIVYINADDLGVMDVGYNSDRYVTPNIDRLASEGMTFTEAHAAAANCAPSRACVFSGQATPRHGVYTVGNSDRGKAAYRKIVPTRNTEHLTDEQWTLAEALAAGGYRTIHLGKWHLGEDPTTQGFDVNIGGNTSGSPGWGYFAPFKKGPMAVYDGQYPRGTHMADIFADEALDFVRRNQDRPFFLHMAYYLVHTPLQPVPEFVDKYADLPVDARYASMIEKMDQSIGRILAGLEETGVADDTLVLFASDNGGICKITPQTPYRAGKGSYFDGGIRIPMVVRWPGEVTAGSRCDVPVTGLDFYPTLLDVAGLTAPRGKTLDGTSLLPLLTGSGSLPPRTLFWHFPVYLQSYGGVKDDSHDPLFRTRPGSVVRRGRWKLHEYFEDGRVELYDLAEDVGERRDRATDLPEKAAELLAELRQWRSDVAAPVPSERNPAYDAAVEQKAIEKAMQ